MLMLLKGLREMENNEINRRMQSDLRSNVQKYIKQGFYVFSRTPELIMCRGLLRVSFTESGPRFIDGFAE